MCSSFHCSIKYYAKLNHQHTEGPVIEYIIIKLVVLFFQFICFSSEVFTNLPLGGGTVLEGNGGGNVCVCVKNSLLTPMDVSSSILYLLLEAWEFEDSAQYLSCS